MARKKPVNRTRTRIRTISGTLTDTNGQLLEVLLDDSNINSTHELLEWKIWPVTAITTIHTYIQGSTKPVPAAGTNRAEINNQYAWAGYCVDSSSDAPFHYYEVTNDGSLFVDNVYICVLGTGSGAKFNYRLRLRETISSDNQAILGIIKQHSQDLDDN